MGRVWEGLLLHNGQTVTLVSGEERVSLNAFLQPAPQQTGQERPSPRGVERRERFLYLGPAGRPLDTDTVVVWNNRQLRVQAAHKRGDPVCPHWWAVLCPGLEAEG